MRPRLLGFVAAAWLIVGGYGAWSYAHDYYVYRGFGPPHYPPGVPVGSLKSVSFDSPALGGRRKYDIYLPAGYAADITRGQRFGVLYLLHGSPGWPRLFVNAGAIGVALDTLVAHRSILPFLVVMPDGRDGSFKSDTEWANTSHGRYESFLTDVVHAVDKRWPTIANRGHRVLAGNSEGAYAAANLALRHLRTFGAFESWSGYFRQTPTGVFHGASASTLRANSPLDLAAARHAALAELPLAAYLYGGAKDPDTRELAPFAAALRAAGAKVVTTVRPGRHDWRLWRSMTPLMLRWAAARMAAAT
jgi:enterochelin esterase-like enzyme